jgi:hypothetical protein
LEFFRVDLMDLWRGRLSLRRIGVLVQSLITKAGRSTLAAAMDEAAEWSANDYLLARLSDAQELSNYLFIKANSSDAKDLAVPDPLPRPGYVEPPKPTYDYSSGSEVASFFSQMSNL